MKVSKIETKMRQAGGELRVVFRHAQEKLAAAGQWVKSAAYQVPTRISETVQIGGSKRVAIVDAKAAFKAGVAVYISAMQGILLDFDVALLEYKPSGYLFDMTLSLGGSMVVVLTQAILLNRLRKGYIPPEKRLSV